MILFADADGAWMELLKHWKDATVGRPGDILKE